MGSVLKYLTEFRDNKIMDTFQNGTPQATGVVIYGRKFKVWKKVLNLLILNRNAAITSPRIMAAGKEISIICKVLNKDFQNSLSLEKII